MAEITSLVINFNGSNNSTNFIDETGKIITPFGSAVISTAQSKFGGSSGYFNGGGYLDVQSSTNLSMSADFTVELWVYTDPSTAAWSRLIENEQHNVTGGWHFSYNGSDSAGSRRLGFQLGLNGGGGGRIDSNSAIPTNQWVHVAVTRYNNVIRMFVNGVQQTAALTTAESFSSSSLRIGATLGSASNYFTGYIDSIQIIKNRALYTENFTVPTEQPQYDPYYNNTSLLIPFDGPNNSTVFGDYSSNRNIITAYGDAKISTTQSKFGGSSLYISGNSGCAVKIPYNLKFDPESYDFTIESWVYPTSLSGSLAQCIVGTFSYGSVEGSPNHTNAGWFFGLLENGTNYLMFGWGNNVGTWTTILSTTTAPTLNTWSHVALVKNGSTFTMYLNGISVGTSTYSTPITLSKQYLRIGSCSNNGTESFYFRGNIDDLRITKGIARYTSNFTPPIQSFYKPYNYDPFLDKLSLLLHMDGDNNSTTFKDSSANNSIIAFGDAKISTTQSKIGGSSGYFDGNGDYLTIPDSTIFDFGTNDFTFECWIYPTAYPSPAGDICVTNGSTNGCGLRLHSNGTISALFNISGTSIAAISTTVVPLNTWTHISQSRSSLTSGKIFINGILENTVTLGTGSQNYPGIGVCIGRNPTNSSWYYTGYIDDLRITKGIARYTTDFTPPVSRFYDLIAKIEYFYSVYNDFVRCALGEAIGDYRNNSRIYIDNDLYFDTVDYGEINIQGYYKIDKTPVYRKIRLCTYPNHFIIRETWSNPTTGFYSFNNIKKQDYVLIFEDYENLHHSKIRRLFMDQL